MKKRPSKEKVKSSLAYKPETTFGLLPGGAEPGPTFRFEKLQLRHNPVRGVADDTTVRMETTPIDARTGQFSIHSTDAPRRMLTVNLPKAIEDRLHELRRTGLFGQDVVDVAEYVLARGLEALAAVVPPPHPYVDIPNPPPLVPAARCVVMKEKSHGKRKRGGARRRARA